MVQPPAAQFQEGGGASREIYLFLRLTRRRAGLVGEGFEPLVEPLI